MKHLTTTSFGRRPLSAAQIEGQILAQDQGIAPRACKWALLEILGNLRKSLGLNRGAISVLQALLSFYPERELQDGPRLIVFPSNQSLQARLHQMPESTLRRHLARLIEAQLIARHDSPNGKRYKARGFEMAFGFSLRPLLLRAAEFAELDAARELAAAEEKAARLAARLRLRDLTKWAAWARELGQIRSDDPLFSRLEALGLALQRRVTPEDLSQLDAFEALLSPITAQIQTPSEPVLSAPAAEIERHQHKTILKDSDSDAAKTKDAISLSQVVAACPDMLPYAGSEILNWESLRRAAQFAHPMMGITRETWDEAESCMGPRHASATLAVMLQNVSRIHKPGAYLRRLSQLARQGRFHLTPMIRALTRSHSGSSAAYA